MSVLSAPSTPYEVQTLNVVILVVSVLSVLGAGFIGLSFVFSAPVNSTGRSKGTDEYILSGLAISDFWMAINFLSSSALNLAHKPIGSPERKQFCNFNGFMIQVFVVQTDYWVLIIAVCTYLILAGHKNWSNWIQEHKYILWILPWVFSLLWAVLGLLIVGYGNIGAWCWFTSDRVRLLVNFIPRWLIIIAILALYLRLYFIILTAQRRFREFDSGPSTVAGVSSERPERGSIQTEGEQDSIQTPHRISATRKRPFFNFATPTSAEENYQDGVRSERAGFERAGSALRRISYQMMAYPLVYLFIWTIPTTIRIYQATTNKPAPFAIGTTDKVCIVVQGFADSIVYGCNERTWRVWRQLFRGQNTMK